MLPTRRVVVTRIALLAKQALPLWLGSPFLQQDGGVCFCNPNSSRPEYQVMSDSSNGPLVISPLTFHRYPQPCTNVTFKSPSSTHGRITLHRPKNESQPASIFMTAYSLFVLHRLPIDTATDLRAALGVNGFHCTDRHGCVAQYSDLEQ